MSERIAVIGAGSVGGTLARALAAAGYAVNVGVRDPEADKYAELRGAGLRLAPPAEAAAAADMVVLATPWEATEAAIAGLGDLSGKLVLDATNPLKFENGQLDLDRGFSTSGGEQVAAWARGARVFKVMNQTGWENMGRAAAFPVRPVMFVAGDDAAAKPAVMALTAALGFEPVDAGPLAAARLLEPLAVLWIHHAFATGERAFAFAFARIPGA